MSSPKSCLGPHPKIDLAGALRRSTAAIHAEIEQLPLMARLTSETVTLDDYRRYLRAILAIQAPLERALYDGIDATVRDRLGVRPKLPALLADLAEQGLPLDPGTALTPPPVLDDLSVRVGGLYVLEGATLGGRTIARHLRRILGELLGATRLLDFHGQHTSAAWKAFTRELNALTAEQRLVPDLVISGALTVFAHVHACLELAGHPPRPEAVDQIYHG
ncbi:MAG: biliverdin-producing heme oxygenase [Thermochromatium sp.]